jgi:adenylate kinase
LQTPYLVVVAERGIAIVDAAPNQTSMIVFLAGLSGAGKTTTAAGFVKHHPEFVHVIASTLIRKAGRPTDEISATDVEPNQAALIQEFIHLRKQIRDASILFDGHMVIETHTGQIAIPDYVVDHISPSHIVVLLDDPETIHSRRGNSRKRRQITSVDEIRRCNETPRNSINKISIR